MHACISYFVSAVIYVSCQVLMISKETGHVSAMNAWMHGNIAWCRVQNISPTMDGTIVALGASAVICVVWTLIWPDKRNMSIHDMYQVDLPPCYLPVARTCMPAAFRRSVLKPESFFCRGSFLCPDKDLLWCCIRALSWRMRQLWLTITPKTPERWTEP